ncbi:uncharacterized protein LOC107692216 [Sinocyclocheilus anshuiensis]|uniref:uncharacterized protein LOC107692216 n=1 Tax=Sinocyclocheilus anshuiensis TaxID=1608454 RepID=UPI0007B87BB5|nr:PREDICTED: uncharacterized protein LOC107692216 [Sinocyclocheilus anshuiensis]
MRRFFQVLIFAGLLPSLAGPEVITEAKTYTKLIIKMSDLEKDDQVIIKKKDKLIAQYFCHAGNCQNEPNTVGQLREHSGYLVLIMRNISPFDRFDAFHNLKPILRNFTLDEVLPTAATPDLTDEALNPSITQTVPLTSTTPAPTTETISQTVPSTFIIPVLTTETTNQTEPPIMTNTAAKVFTGVGASVLVVAVLVVAVLAVTFFRRRCCGPLPHQQHARPIEMENFLPNPDQV